MKYGLALLLSFFLFAQVVMSQTESTKFWTLEECIEYALAKSLDVQGGVLQERSAEFKLAQSKWGFAPSFNANAGLNYTFGRAIDFGTNSVSNDLQSTNFTIQASLSLFEGQDTIVQYKPIGSLVMYNVQAMSLCGRLLSSTW